MKVQSHSGLIDDVKISPSTPRRERAPALEADGQPDDADHQEILQGRAVGPTPEAGSRRRGHLVHGQPFGSREITAPDR